MSKVDNKQNNINNNNNNEKLQFVIVKQNPKT